MENKEDAEGRSTRGVGDRCAKAGLPLAADQRHSCNAATSINAAAVPDERPEVYADREPRKKVPESNFPRRGTPAERGCVGGGGGGAQSW